MYDFEDTLSATRPFTSARETDIVARATPVPGFDGRLPYIPVSFAHIGSGSVSHIISGTSRTTVCGRSTRKVWHPGTTRRATLAYTCKVCVSRVDPNAVGYRRSI